MLKTTITGSVMDVSGKAVRISTKDEEGKESEVILSADFCHYCKDDLAKEFADFMEAKGYDIKRNA